MKKYFPDSHCLFTLRITIISVSLLLAVAVNYFITVGLLVILTDIIIGASAFFLMFAYLPLFIRSLGYTLTENEIIRSGGVIMKTHQSVKFSSIQYTKVITTPFSQYTGINFIVCFVYGGRLSLLFLNHEDAREILKKIDSYTSRGGGGDDLS
ncbi:MAG: PH domain-containing protein [Ruminococcus sp.]|nr:PH domain-containing protein [Ruminococcus sp.]